MTHILNKHKKGLALLIFLFCFLKPVTSFAHNAYFLQVLVDDQKFQYVGSVVEDNASYFETESKHLEVEMGKFGGLDEKVHPNKETKEDYEKYEKDLNDKVMIFTFSPNEISNWYGAAKNHATSKDVDKAYTAQENLMNGLNDALRVVNDGKTFTSAKKMIEKGNELAVALNKGGTVGDYQVSKGKTIDGKPQKGFEKDDYVTLTNVKDKNEVYEFIYRYKKGYSSNDKYKDDTEYLTWNQLMYQGNYAMIAKGYTLRNGAELAKPGPVEQAVVSLLGNTFNQLRNLLGLYDINDLVFNEGIRGSSAWTHGIMSKDWSEQAIAYHWVFQALAWSLITFAIVKILVQRNFATINPVMRISLMESVQDLLITGVLLANAVPVINMFMFLNAKLVAVFASTAPDYANFVELNAYSNMLGGILIQFFYLGLSIYLNFVYLMRAITLSILIASAPLFIVTIAFGGKWKQLFNTWIRELIGNIFLQSFHAFMLSFFFAISTSSRGIESMVVLLALIPMTEFFRSLVMGQSGGIAHKMGMQSMSQARSVVGGALASTNSGGKAKQNGSKDSSGGSGRERSTSANDSGMNNVAGNSEKIKNNSSSMNQRTRMNSTKQALNNRETPARIAELQNKSNKSPQEKQELANFTNTKDFQTKPEGRIQKAMDMAQSIPEKMEKSKEAFDNSVAGKVTNGVAKGAMGTAKVVAGASQTAIGLGTAMAVGMEDPKMVRGAMQSVGAGKSLMANGKSNLKDSASSIGSTIPENTKSFATNLPNGDLQVHRSGKAMADNGVTGASMEGNGKNQLAKYSYDTSKMPSGDKANIDSAYNAFASGDKGLIDHYKANGIEGAYKQGNNTVLRYNQAGMEQMGIKSVQTIGAGGSNPRIVETKNNFDPVNTKMSLSIPKYSPPQQQPENNGNGNKKPNPK